MDEETLPAFRTCARCGKHGRLVLSLAPTPAQAVWQMEVYARKLAYKVIGAARRAGVIATRADLDRLIAQVVASPLPKSTDDVPRDLCDSVMRWNEDLRKGIPHGPLDFACRSDAP